MVGVRNIRYSVSYGALMLPDTSQSLNFGRPYSTPAQLCDCPFPESIDPSHAYKYRLAQTFFRIADCLASPELPDYAVVVELDTELRRVESSAPPWLRWADDLSTSHGLNLTPRQWAQQHAATLFCHKALLGELELLRS